MPKEQDTAFYKDLLQELDKDFSYFKDSAMKITPIKQVVSDLIGEVTDLMRLRRQQLHRYASHQRSKEQCPQC